MEPLKCALPSEADVRWIDNGTNHTVKVKLEGMVPNNLPDDFDLYFIINTNGTVDMKVFKPDDTDGVVKLLKEARPKGEYSLGFINKTDHDLAAVSAYYGDKRAGVAGDIPIRVRLGYSDLLTLPIPLETEVRWDENGMHHAVKTKLAGVVTNGFEGRIFFIIKSDDAVEVKPINADDTDGGIRLMRQLYPKLPTR